MQIDPMGKNDLLELAQRAGDRSARSLEEKYGFIAGKFHPDRYARTRDGLERARLPILHVTCTYMGEESPTQEGVFEQDPQRICIFCWNSLRVYFFPNALFITRVVAVPRLHTAMISVLYQLESFRNETKSKV